MMRTYVYSFQSVVGTFWIRPEGNKGWSLCIADEGTIEVLGHYESPSVPQMEFTGSALGGTSGTNERAMMLHRACCCGRGSL